jgi:hypothetical protein
MRKFDIDELKSFIMDSSDETKIYIGADSERYRGKDDMWHADYTVAIVIHKDGNKGCKVFGKVTTERDYDNRHDRPALRLMNEVYRAAEMYLELVTLLEIDTVRCISISILIFYMVLHALFNKPLGISEALAMLYLWLNQMHLQPLMRLTDSRVF